MSSTASRLVRWLLLAGLRSGQDPAGVFPKPGDREVQIVVLNAKCLLHHLMALAATVVFATGQGAGSARGACIALNPDAYWSGGVVPYSLDGNVSSLSRDRLMAAMAVWESAARIRFIDHTLEGNWIHFRSDSYDGADIGRQAIGFQTVHISSWTDKYRIVHIIGHALGLGDEHMRDDSDEYLTFNDGNWDANKVSQHLEGELLLERWPHRIADYDLLSVMHPSECSFSKCDDCPSDPTDCRAIEVRSPHEALQPLIGRVEQLSKTDARIISLLYPPPDWRVVNYHLRDGIGQPRNGTLIEPFRFMQEGLPATPSGGTLWIAPAKYDFRGVINQRVTLRCPYTDHHPAISSPTAAVLGLAP